MKELTCYDCPRPYKSDGFVDLLIPNWAWLQIAPKPDGNGVLCPSCILIRLAKAGIECNGAFLSGNIRTCDPDVFDINEAQPVKESIWN